MSGLFIVSRLRSCAVLGCELSDNRGLEVEILLATQPGPWHSRGSAATSPAWLYAPVTRVASAPGFAGGPRAPGSPGVALCPRSPEWLRPLVLLVGLEPLAHRRGFMPPVTRVASALVLLMGLAPLAHPVWLYAPGHQSGFGPWFCWWASSPWLTGVALCPRSPEWLRPWFCWWASRPWLTGVALCPPVTRVASAPGFAGGPRAPGSPAWL